MFKAAITGRLTADAMLSTKANVANFTLAVGTNFLVDGQYKTEFVRVAVWGKRGEAAARLLKKGDAVTCSGDFRTNEFKRADGTPGTNLHLENADWEFGMGKGRNDAAETDDDEDDMFSEDE